jgi:nitrogen-specific signal transduction histidine kinase
MGNRCQIDSITVAIDHASAIGALSVRQRAVVIVVADNGYGIPDGLHQTLFDSFKSHKADGYGQGLWVVREIVAGHGGQPDIKVVKLQVRVEPSFASRSRSSKRCENASNQRVYC